MSRFGMAKKWGLAVVCLLGLCLSACGAEAGKEAAGSGEYGYLTEFQDFENMEGAIQEAVLSKDENTVFFTVSPDTYGGGPGVQLYRLKDKAVRKVELEGLKETESVAALAAAADGSLRLAVMDYGDPAGCEIWTVDEDGNKKDSMDITSGFPQDLSQGINGMALDGEGNMYVISNAGLCVFDGSGTVLFQVPDIMPLDIVCTGGDTVTVVLYELQNMEMREVDLQKKALGEVKGDSDELFRGIRFVRGNGEELLYFDNDRLFVWQPEAGWKELLSFMDYNINGDTVDAVLQKKDGGYTILTTEKSFSLEENTMVAGRKQAAELMRVDASTLPEKTVIVFGIGIADSDIKKEVIDFNKKSDRYMIRMKDYIGKDYNMKEARERMNMDIMTGKGPDILDLTDMGSDLYVSRGLLEDLTPWFERDEELQKGTYLENVMDTYRKDGKLYGIVPNFNISTLAGKKSVVGDGDAWTLEDVMKLAEEAGDTKRLFPSDITKSSLLINICLPARLDQFVNWETGECHFDSGEFVRLLEFADTFGGEEGDGHDWDAIPDDLKSGRQLLSVTVLSNVQNYLVFEELLGEEVNFIGYPVESGCGSKISPYRCFGIMASSDEQVKEGAWQFLRTYLTEEYQDSIGPLYGFPVLESSLEKRFEKAMTPEYYEDGNGNRVEKPKMTDFLWGMQIDTFAAPKETVEKLDGLIHRLDAPIKKDLQIEKVIEEETGAYFEGAKSAEETAKIIQSRIKTYVEENR